MKRIATISALVLVAAMAPAALAKHKMHDHDMMMPTMEQCHDGYKKEFKESMHWSKHKFKKACHKMMHGMMHDHDNDAMMKDKMAKDKMMKDKMMKDKMEPEKK